mmetsp:Transcript_45624/g.76013  ORF Transcript_45624/g.76013 Transcript_45624/m.76013 type:complete len:217 (+) Transcript_45624:162-812(+)
MSTDQASVASMEKLGEGGEIKRGKKTEGSFAAPESKNVCADVETSDHSNRKVFICVDPSPRSRQMIQVFSRQMMLPNDRITFVHAVFFEKMSTRTPYNLSEEAKSSIKIWNDECKKKVTNEIEKLFMSLADEIKAIDEAVFKRAQYRIFFSQTGVSNKKILLEKIAMCQPDLVVVGSRGMGAAGRMFLGSTSDFLVHNVPCSIAIIKCCDNVTETK